MSLAEFFEHHHCTAWERRELLRSLLVLRLETLLLHVGWTPPEEQ